MSSEPESKLPPVDLAHDSLVEVALEAGQEVVVRRRTAVAVAAATRELPPELRQFRGLGNLELKLVVCPLQEGCV